MRSELRTTLRLALLAFVASYVFNLVLIIDV